MPMSQRAARLRLRQGFFCPNQGYNSMRISPHPFLTRCIMVRSQLMVTTSPAKTTLSAVGERPPKLRLGLHCLRV